MKSYLFTLLIFLCGASVTAQDFAKKQLENSPRHHEWVEIDRDDRTVHSFVAYPEKKENSLAVIVIHENRGLTDWVRSFADQLAGKGYIAIAPDLLSEFDAEHSKTSDFASSDEARSALYELDPDQITGDLKAVQKYIENVPSSNGKVVVAGFCWGGSQTFRYATNASVLEAAMVFYGSPPEKEQLKNIEAPIYGFYGENDQRINSTIPETEKAMKALGKTYDYVIYDGAGHAYMRDGDAPDGSEANKKARDQSWTRLLGILSEL